MVMSEFDVANSVEIWGEITRNKKPREDIQEILVSLSYLPSAERLTVVLLKARNLLVPQCKGNSGKNIYNSNFSDYYSTIFIINTERFPIRFA